MLTDGEGNTWSLEKDEFGRLMTATAPATDAGVGVSTYTYNNLSQVESITDPLGRLMCQRHDLAGRLEEQAEVRPVAGVCPPGYGVWDFNYELPTCDPSPRGLLKSYQESSVV
jgi:YD repeat-containing protein